MCDSSNPKSGRENGFVFSAAAADHSAAGRPERKFRKHGGRMAAAYNKTTSSSSASASLSPSCNDHQQPSWQWRFSYPSNTLDEGTEGKNSKSKPKENGILEKAKIRSCPLSAITGVIPCYFDESRYSSQPPTCNSAGMEALINNEIILVSRILKGIPQSPHFLPLKGYSEVAKNSLIKAWDRVFEDVVNQIQSMQTNSFWVEAKRLWETMEELQKMGYNVIALRRRLVELTDVMLKLRKHRREMKELKSKAEEQRMEKSRLGFEIVKLRAKVEALKVGYEEVMGNVENMEKDMPKFDDVFSKIATKKIEIIYY